MIIKRTLHGRRKARPLKKNQKDLLETAYPSARFNIEELFSIDYKNVALEIGFGGGENIAFQAKQNPNTLYIGCEPFINGVVSLLKKIQEENISNIRIFQDNALLLLEQLPSNFLDESFILFPDPWPKKRHHKRRFLQLSNLLLLHAKMKANAILHVATDHVDYLEWIVDIINTSQFQSCFSILHKLTFDRPSPQEIPQTRYEMKALKQGRKGNFLKFQVKKILP